MIRSAINTASLSDAEDVETISECDVINAINEYFDDLEYKVYASRISSIDKRIPFLVIRKFKRLFELWDENAAFSRYLEGDSFREIFAVMYNVFGYNYNKGSSGDCYLACELCGEEIVLRNNDPEYSYRAHETSKYHVEFVRNLEAIRTEKEVDLILAKNSNEKGTVFECHLCLVFIPIVSRGGNDEIQFAAVMDSHQQDVKHLANMQIFNLNKTYVKVYDMEEKLYVCSPCEEVYHVDLLMDHLRSSTHAENVNAKERVPKKNVESKAVGLKEEVDKADFDVFKTNMKLIRVIDDAIQCSLCDCNLTSVNTVVEHLTSEKHVKNLETYMASAESVAEEGEVKQIDQAEESSLLGGSKCEQKSANDVLPEELPSKKTSPRDHLSFGSNYLVLFGLVAMVSISIMWYQIV